MSASELERERAYVRTLYARLDELQLQAREQLDAVRRQDVGGNHQSRSERDAFARMYEDRIVQLRDVDERLAFGRLELAGTDLPEYRYIGRVGLRDAEQHPLLVDWRAPQAGAFYQATAKTPLGTRARRHLLSKGRDVLRIEDEIFDAELLEDGRMVLQGEGALLAALTTRAHRPDARHRGDHPGRAGPDHPLRPGRCPRGAGRAGHRQDRRRAAPRRLPAVLAPGAAQVAGVLIVGPSRSFIHYIEAVLPSLGEIRCRALQRRPAVSPAWMPAAEERRTSPRSRGRADGRIDRAGGAVTAARARQPQVLEVNGDRITLEPALVARAIAKARERGKPHNVARVAFVKSCSPTHPHLAGEGPGQHR